MNMNVNTLKCIAYETLKSIPCINQLPINSISIAEELGIPILKDSLNEYLNTSDKETAILINSDTTCIYYNDNLDSSNINYTISSEIARYLLQTKYKDFDAQDICILGMFLLCPPIVLKALKFNQPHEIITYCNVPEYQSKLFLSQLTYCSDIHYDIEKTILNQFKPFIKSFKRQQPFRTLFKFIVNIAYKEAIKDINPHDTDIIEAIEYVFIHPGNLYYHKLDCPLLNNQDRTERLPIKIACFKGYKPCSTCYKN